MSIKEDKGFAPAVGHAKRKAGIASIEILDLTDLRRLDPPHSGSSQCALRHFPPTVSRAAMSCSDSLTFSATPSRTTGDLGLGAALPQRGKSPAPGTKALRSALNRGR